MSIANGCWTSQDMLCFCGTQMFITIAIRSAMNQMNPVLNLHTLFPKIQNDTWTTVCHHFMHSSSHSLKIKMASILCAYFFTKLLLLNAYCMESSESICQHLMYIRIITFSFSPWGLEQICSLYVSISIIVLNLPFWKVFTK
jgi:hypothetical protein